MTFKDQIPLNNKSFNRMSLAARYYAFDEKPSAAIRLETVEKPVPGAGNKQSDDDLVFSSVKDFSYLLNIHQNYQAKS